MPDGGPRFAPRRLIRAPEIEREHARAEPCPPRIYTRGGGPAGPTRSGPSVSPAGGTAAAGSLGWWTGLDACVAPAGPTGRAPPGTSCSCATATGSAAAPQTQQMMRHWGCVVAW